MRVLFLSLGVICSGLADSVSDDGGAGSRPISTESVLEASSPFSDAVTVTVLAASAHGAV